MDFRLAGYTWLFFVTWHLFCILCGVYFVQLCICKKKKKKSDIWTIMGHVTSRHLSTLVNVLVIPPSDAESKIRCLLLINTKVYVSVQWLLLLAYQHMTLPEAVSINCMINLFLIGSNFWFWRNGSIWLLCFLFHELLYKIGYSSCYVNLANNWSTS